MQETKKASSDLWGGQEGRDSWVIQKAEATPFFFLFFFFSNQIKKEENIKDDPTILQCECSLGIR